MRQILLKRDANDLKWGAADIGKCIGVSARRAYFLLESGAIPAKKIGGKWVASETVLLNSIIETGEVAAE
ncbi:hypothetical protein SAMN05428967_3363 [Phyllobacterium sp. YR620]|nr:hypothetical protein SAMN05428967_3363 [Phyllobacterium sp. YR620]